MEFHFLHKAKTKDMFRWITGWLIQKDGGWQIFSGGKFYAVEPHTICAFTGAYDLHHTMIFEGDFIYNFRLRKSAVMLWDNHLKRFEIKTDNMSLSLMHIKQGNTVVLGSAYDIPKIAAEIPEGIDRNTASVLQECTKKENIKRFGSIKLSNEYKAGGILL